MSRRRRDLLVIFAGAGCFQITGCAAGLVPLTLSFAESAVLSTIVRAILGL